MAHLLAIAGRVLTIILQTVNDWSGVEGFGAEFADATFGWRMCGCSGSFLRNSRGSRFALRASLRPTAVRKPLRGGWIDAGLKPRSTSEATATKATADPSTSRLRRFAQDDTL